MGILNKVKCLFSNEARNEEVFNTDKAYKNLDKSVKKELLAMENKMIQVIHVNPNVYLAQRGARICIGQDTMKESYIKQATYVSKVLNRGHESVSEHTNVIGLFGIPNIEIIKYIDSYTEMLANMHFCNVTTKDGENLNYMLFSGSARAFIHCVRECNIDNYFVNEYLKPFIYQSFDKELMTPLIKNNMMEEDKFQYLPDGEISEVEDKVVQVKNTKEKTDVENSALDCDNVFEPEEYDEEHVTLIYQSPIQKLYNKVKDYGFTLKDVYKVATVTFIFHDISRTCSHQLVRHRVGISQESQRYVAHDYTKENFINPIKMNYEDRYKDSKFNSVIKKMDEINPFSNYAYLLSSGILKEDARAWLPSNVTTQLMMTFTYWQYAHFLYFRLEKGAQKEIRENCADESSWFLFNDSDTRQKFIDLCMENNTTSIEQELLDTISEEDVDEELTEEEIKSLEINNEDDAKKLIEESERLSKLK